MIFAHGDFSGRFHGHDVTITRCYNYYLRTGEPPKTGTATIRIYTKNKNDEEPKFSQQVYTPNVDENAGPNTLVTTVVASDKDGDNVRYVSTGTHRIMLLSSPIYFRFFTLVF